jgi:hypothetical protein
MDGHGDIDQGNAATFVPILRMTTKGDPNYHVPRQVHRQLADGSWKRVPFYTGTEAQNRKAFKQDSNKSWFQVQLVNNSEWTTTGRSTDYHNLSDMIKRDHPGDLLSARHLRAKLFGDCVNFSAVVAQSILAGPKSHRATIAMRNFKKNLEGRAGDVRWQIEAVEPVFGPRKFYEYLNVVVQGVNQHFPCRHLPCRAMCPNDCWLTAWNSNGTFEDPNLHQLACPTRGDQYYRTADPKHFSQWSQICPAQKIMCVQDLNMQAARNLPGPLPPTATAEDDSWSGRNRNTAFTIGDWAFYLTEWPDHTIQVLEDDLKAAWADTKQICDAAANTDQILKTILDLARNQRQQPYFETMEVPVKVIRRVLDHNAEGHKKKWSFHLLPTDPATDRHVIPYCQYTYRAGDGTAGSQTPVLSSKDQCRMWCYASYAIEYALIAERSAQSSSNRTATGASSSWQ